MMYRLISDWQRDRSTSKSSLSHLACLSLNGLSHPREVHILFNILQLHCCDWTLPWQCLPGAKVLCRKIICQWAAPLR